MNFLALNDDVKNILSNHLASDLKIRQLSKNHDLQKILFNKVFYNDDFCRDVVYIGSTCDTLSLCYISANSSKK